MVAKSWLDIQDIIYLDLHFVVSIRGTVLYSMLRQQARSIYDIFNELISDLQQAVLNLFVELLVWIHLTHELLKTRLCEKLQKKNLNFTKRKQAPNKKLTTAEFSELELVLFCPVIPDIDGEFWEGDTMSFMSLSID